MEEKAFPVGRWHGLDLAPGGLSMINRAALIVRPKAPYIDWAKSLQTSGELPSPDGEQTVYLIPEFEDLDDLTVILADVYEEIFEKELFGWNTDESTWPTERTMEEFLNWFKIEVHTMIDDLVGDEFIDDEWDEDGDDN